MKLDLLDSIDTTQWNKIAKFIHDENKKTPIWQKFVSVGEVAKKYGVTEDEVMDFVEDRDDMDLIVGFKSGDVGVAEICNQSNYKIESIVE